MPVTASALRANIYRLLDQVLESGEPLIIERHGRRLRIIAEPSARDFANLPSHPGAIVGDPDELVHMDWLDEWTPTL